MRHGKVRSGLRHRRQKLLSRPACVGRRDGRSKLPDHGVRHGPNAAISRKGDPRIADLGRPGLSRSTVLPHK